MKNIYSEYKEKICTSCIHYGDNSFQDCEIRECINSNEQNCKTRAKCYFYEKEKKDVRR